MRVLRLARARRSRVPWPDRQPDRLGRRGERVLLPFTNNANATVLSGNLLTLPVGGGLLYVQPLYTQRTTGDGNYPVLRLQASAPRRRDSDGELLDLRLQRIRGRRRVRIALPHKGVQRLHDRAARLRRGRTPRRNPDPDIATRVVSLEPLTSDIVASAANRWTRPCSIQTRPIRRPGDPRNRRVAVLFDGVDAIDTEKRIEFLVKKYPGGKFCGTARRRDRAAGTRSP